MTKAEKRRASTSAQVVECMTPDTVYSLAQIARLIGTGPPEAQRLLSACVAKGKVKESRAGKRAAYSLRTEEDIRIERERAALNTLPRGVLQGYDVTHRRFRELCMATRGPLPGAPDRNVDGPPDE
ncbi:hypothetical protein R75461_07652 [Paraburkholderia nemoris]|uniref:hypothetical protein n=1 Tax=Paraburkholderia nemoris TaxID=2793076 RepID=UPI00190979EB|nr:MULTISPECIES: hypothetical protein [Paraburkholderia]MBK3786398.1 hypothetical protein [Paraburkholderia aspalathi]CAE6854760.1 hypothetical protein R75461_07652 [Paraburkholderia nemoris]